MRTELPVCRINLGGRAKKGEAATKQSLCREDTLGCTYHTFSVSAPLNLFVCLPWSQGNLERAAPHLSAQQRVISSYLPPPEFFFSFSSFWQTWSRLSALFCPENDKRPLWWGIGSQWKINELDRRGARVCVCVWYWSSYPSMTHTGLAHLSWSVDAGRQRAKVLQREETFIPQKEMEGEINQPKHRPP